MTLTQMKKYLTAAELFEGVGYDERLAVAGILIEYAVKTMTISPSTSALSTLIACWLKPIDFVSTETKIDPLSSRLVAAAFGSSDKPGGN